MRALLLLISIIILSAFFPILSLSQNNYTEWKILNNFTTDGGLSDDEVNYIFIDNQNIKWICAGNKMHIYTNLVWNSSQPIPAPKEFLQTLSDKEGKFWIRTKSKGVYWYDGQLLWNQYLGSDYFGSDSTRAIARDSNNNIWIASIGGLAFTSDNGSSWTDKYSIIDDTSNTINSMIVDKDGALWIGTTKGLIKYYQNITTAYDTSNGLPNNNILALAVDHDNNIWISTKGGISKYNSGDNKFENITPDPDWSDLLKNNIIAIATDSIKDNNFVYFGFSYIETGEGLPIL